MNFSHSTYSRDGRWIVIYLTKLTKLGSNKRKGNKALIWAIISHYCKAKINFSVYEFTRFYASQILILWSSGCKLWCWWGSPFHDVTGPTDIGLHTPPWNPLKSC